MKQTILILIAFLMLSSCSDEQTLSKRDIPIEVVNLKESQNFDTILQIQTEKFTFQFSKENEYIGSFRKSEPIGLLLFIFTLIGIILGIAIRSILD